MRNRILLCGRIVSWLIWALIFAPVMKTPLVPMAQAQSQCSTVLEEAEEAFNSGRLEDVIRLLNSCLPSGIPDAIQKLRAYKLLALAYISANQPDSARNVIKALVDLNPNYEPDPLQESASFMEFVAEAKQRRLHNVANPSDSKKWLWIGGSGVAVIGAVTALIYKGGKNNTLSKLPDPPKLP